MWIRKNFPDLFYIVSPGDNYGMATWSAINTVVKGIKNDKISNSWLAEHIQQNHGPLGAVYPDVAWGMEGDTPSFLSLIPTGLSDPEHPEWGGWGGRYEWYTSQTLPNKQKAIRVFPSKPKRDLSGPTPSTVIPISYPARLGGRCVKILPSLITKCPCGGGAMIFKTILRPGWTGAQNPTRRLTIHQYRCWTTPTNSL